MTIDEMIEVLQAIKAGEMVQAFPIITQGDTFDWFEWPQKALNFQDYDYRVKPKPMEAYITFYKGANFKYGGAYASYDRAASYLSTSRHGKVVKFIEVIE